MFLIEINKKHETDVINAMIFYYQELNNTILISNHSMNIKQNLIMQKNSISFNQQYPEKIITAATIIAKHFDKKVQVPSSPIKTSHLKQLAENKKKEVEFAVKDNLSQNDLFRKLQKQDLKNRDHLLDKIQKRIQKINNHKNQVIKKISADFHKTNDKFAKKHHEFQLKEQEYAKTCEKRSFQITKELMAFHKIQKDKEEKQWSRLRALKTCFNPAQRMISRRESLKQEFANQTEKEIDQDYQKNGPKINPELQIRNSKRSKRLRDTSLNYEKKFNQRRNHFIQTYCRDLDTANTMQNLKLDKFNKTSSSIHKKIKERHQKSSQRKQQFDHEAAQVSDRCTQRMDQALKSEFKMTMTNSTFHSTCKSWFNKNNVRKIELKQIQNRRDDNILEKHTDTTRINKGQDSLNTTLLDLKMKAGFNAREFL